MRWWRWCVDCLRGIDNCIVAIAPNLLLGLKADHCAWAEAGYPIVANVLPARLLREVAPICSSGRRARPAPNIFSRKVPGA